MYCKHLSLMGAALTHFTKPLLSILTNLGKNCIYNSPNKNSQGSQDTAPKHTM